MFVAGIDAHATYSVIAIVSNAGELVHKPVRIKNSEAGRIDELLRRQPAHKRVAHPLANTASGREARVVAHPGPLRTEQGDFHHSAPPLKQSHGARGPFRAALGDDGVARWLDGTTITRCGT